MLDANALLFELTIVELLLLVTVVAMIARRIRIPYTVVLVLVGLLLSFGDPFEIVDLTPEVIMLLILPPLVFEAALHIDVATLRRVLTPVLLLAVPGVLIVTFLVGGILDLSGLLDWRVALLFGSLIAATDPVAVVSLFKTLGAPKRLATLVESESLFNDGTSIVVFTIIAGMMAGGHMEGGVINVIGEGIFEFAKVAFGGVAVGVAIGIIGDRVFNLLDDHLIETMLSTVIAYGAYVSAETFHLSGVLAVVTAGIIVGMGRAGSMSPTTRTVLMSFWEYVAFLSNSVVFIVIGLEAEFSKMATYWPHILVAVIAVLLARAISVYSLSFISNRMGEKISFSYQHVLFWGGLRGAVSLALVLTITDPAYRDLLVNMTFGVVLFTLLVQATTISGLLGRLGLVGRPKTELEYEEIQGRLMATRSAYRRLSEQYAHGIIDPHAWEVVGEDLKARMDELQQELTDFATINPEVVDKIIHSTQREALRTQRAAVMDLQSEGVISEEVAQLIYEDIDVAMDKNLNPGEPEDENGDDFIATAPDPETIDDEAPLIESPPEDKA